jgi:outer membrane protein
MLCNRERYKMKFINMRNCIVVIITVVIFLTVGFGHAEDSGEKPLSDDIASRLNRTPPSLISGASSSGKNTKKTVPESLPVNSEGYVEIDLDTAVKFAVTENPAIKSARTRIDSARGKYLESKSAMGFNLKLQGNYTRIDPVPEAEIPLDGPDNPPTKLKMGNENNFSSRVVLQKILSTFGNLENSIRAAALQIDVQEMTLESAKQTVAYQAKADYFQALQATAMVDVAVDNRKIAEEQLKLTKKMYDNGVVPRYNVLKAELGVSRAEQGVVAAENGRQLAVARLLNTMALPLDTKVKLKVDYVADPVCIDREKAFITAVENRPEVHALVFSYRALEHLLKAAYKVNAPTLVFNSVYEKRSVTSFGAVPSQMTNMLNLEIPLYDSGAKKAKVTQAKASLDDITASSEQFYNGLNLEVKQAVLNIHELVIFMESSRKDVETAREGYTIARKRYENGISTQLELDDAQRELNLARINHLNAIYRYNTALAGLEKAVGVSWKGVVKNNEQ